MILKKKYLELVYFIVLVGFFSLCFDFLFFLRGLSDLLHYLVSLLLLSSEAVTRTCSVKRLLQIFFAIFARKNRCRRLFLVKVVGSVPVFLLKGDF